MKDFVIFVKFIRLAGTDGLETVPYLFIMCRSSWILISLPHKKHLKRKKIHSFPKVLTRWRGVNLSFQDLFYPRQMFQDLFGPRQMFRSLFRPRQLFQLHRSRFDTTCEYTKGQTKKSFSLFQLFQLFSSNSPLGV